MKDVSRNWGFAVKAGDSITYAWPLSALKMTSTTFAFVKFNGFYREFKGNATDAEPEVHVTYEQDVKTGKLTGNVLLQIC